MYGEAVAEFQRARELGGSHGALAAGALGHIYAVTGRRREALQVLNELLKLDRDVPYAVATVYLGLGEKRQAVEWLQKVPGEDATWLLRPTRVWTRCDPSRVSKAYWLPFNKCTDLCEKPLPCVFTSPLTSRSPSGGSAACRSGARHQPC
jgi:tetratricopeptide (TPR) repeat protein